MTYDVGLNSLSQLGIAEIASNSVLAWFVLVPSVFVHWSNLFNIVHARRILAGKGLIHYVVQPCRRLFQEILA